METLIQLLTAYGASEEIVALAQRLVDATVPEPAEGDTEPESRLLSWQGDPLTDAELETLRTYLEGLGDDNDAEIELLEAALDGVSRIREEETYRDAAAEAAASEREDLVTRLRGERAEEPADEAGDPAEGGDEDETEGGDPAEGGDTEATDDAGAEEEEGDREPVLAGAVPGRRVSRSELARRQPRRQPPNPAPDPADTTTAALSDIVFAADVPETPAGRITHTLADVDRALERRRDGFRRTHRGRGASSAGHSKDGEAGPQEYLTVATVMSDYPENRRLMDADGEMLSSAQVTRIIREAIDDGIAATRERGGMVAAGGLCALPTPLYNVVTYGNPRRPIRDQALVSFQAARGGVTDLTPPTLGNILTGDAAGRAISEWTVQNDEDATAGTPTKPCQRVTCGAQRTTQIYAVTYCLTVGNILARTYPELQNAWSSLALIAHARFSEALMFARLQTLATTTTNTMTDFSASRDVLTILDQTAAGMRSRHRLDDDFPFIVILPSLLNTIFRIDISRSLPGGSFQENLTLAQAQINAWFASRFITPVWSPDVNTIGNQGADTALAALPPTINYVMYPAGTFIHLDGGELDLGVVRDTATNAVNDFQVFSETFENIHMVGPEAIDGTIDVCPSGAVAGTIDPAPFCASYT